MSKDLTDFQTLRSYFHELVDCAPMERTDRLAEIRASEPAVGDALAELLAHADPADLSRPVSWLPERIGPFAVGELLGRGGMGEVRVGERVDGGFTQRVALKLLKPLVHAPALHQRFQREQQVLARLEHPHIARLIDGGVHAQTLPWLAMELVEGSDLGEWLRRRRPSLNDRVDLLVKVCDAVAFAHRQLVVHRDLKPANIRVGHDGEPKLLDFGLAKLLDDPGSDTFSKYGMAMTPRYASPEQVLGERIDTAIDIHALGVLGFEMMTGMLPYRSSGDGHTSWSSCIVAPERLDLAKVIDTTPGLSFDEVRRARRFLPAMLAKAMARDRDARYPSASALADDLRDWRTGLPPRSGIGTARERVLAFARRHRIRLGIAATALTGLLVMLGITIDQAHRAQAQAARAEQQTSALLEVLSAASPDHYAGEDPSASSFLLEAARRVDATVTGDDRAVARSLTQIGVGLINLSRPEAAAEVLERAWQRADVAPETTIDSRFDLIKLQALVVDPRTDEALATLRRLDLRLTGWRLRADDPAASVAAEAALGAAFALADEPDAAARWFRCCDADLPTRHPDLPIEVVEGIFRQKARALAHIGKPAEARDNMIVSVDRILAAPDRFPALRLAEARVFIAETSMDLGDFARASEELDLAEPVVIAEYGTDHAERYRFSVLRSLLSAWRGETSEIVVNTERTNVTKTFDLQRLEILIDVDRQACVAAQQAVVKLTPATPRQHAQKAQLGTHVAEHCTDLSGKTAAHE